jgi:hypothetical protein
LQREDSIGPRLPRAPPTSQTERRERSQPSTAFGSTDHPAAPYESVESGAKIKDADVKDFGKRCVLALALGHGQAKLPTVTCFMDEAGYLGLTLNSQNPKFLTFAAAKTLLEKAAALRKSFYLSMSASLTRLMAKERSVNPSLCVNAFPNRGRKVPGCWRRGPVARIRPGPGRSSFRRLRRRLETLSG